MSLIRLQRIRADLTEFALEVWRTQHAINRSSHKTPIGESSLSSTVKSHTHSGFNKSTVPLPRGHLAFYRKIVPPTPCIAFRARVDYEDVEGKERAVLASAGEEAIYIWDLDEEGSVETIPTGLNKERIQVGLGILQWVKRLSLTSFQYIEFDEEYIFICSIAQIHVYSRSTQTKVISFPGKSDTSNELSLNSETPWSLSFSFDLVNNVENLPRQPVKQGEPDVEPEYYENWMGKLRGVEDYPGMQEGRAGNAGSPGRLESPGRLYKPQDFSA